MYEIIHDLVDIKTLRFLALKATYMYLVHVVYTFVSERMSWLLCFFSKNTESKRRCKYVNTFFLIHVFSRRHD